MGSSFTLTSPESAAVLRDRLAAALGRRGAAFRGWADGDEFELRRVPKFPERYFRVDGRGRFEPALDGGTVVRVRMVQHPLNCVGLAAIAGGCLYVVLYSSGGDDWLKPWFFSAVVLFLGFLMFVSTVAEERTCRDWLADALPANRMARSVPPRRTR